MRYLVQTSYQPCTIHVNITAKKSCVVYLNAYDAEQAGTFLMKRFRVFSSGESLPIFVQMPQCGANTIIEIYANAGDDSQNFAVTEIKKIGLARQIDVATLRNENVKNFVPFAQRFCYNASQLQTFDDRNYVSDKGGFGIKYSAIITDNNITPARISTVTKVIEVSKAKFLPMTVPIRMCILCHEFSHLYLNQDMYNELEADLNGLSIYLGLGYPRYEAEETFRQIYEQADTEEVKMRYEHVKNFINEFENLNLEHL
jgi:hypothetical protein